MKWYEATRIGRNEKNTVFVRGRNETTEWGLNGTPICVFNIVAPAVVTTKPSNGTLFLPHLSRAEFADRRFQSIDERQTGVNDILIQLVPIDLLHNFILMFRFFFMRWVFTLWREFDSSQQGHRLYLHFCLHSWTRWAGIRWMLGWKLCWSTLPWCKFPCVFSHFMKEKQKQNYEKEMSSVRCLVKTFLRFCCASRRDNIKMREEGLTRWLRAQWGNI